MRRRLGAGGRAAQRPGKQPIARRWPHGRQRRGKGVAAGHAGRGHGHWYRCLKRYVVELLYVAVLVPGTDEALALVAKCRGLARLLNGVGVRVQGQYPRPGQQRPPEAEQQQ